jgi:hypothetical protein
MDLLSPGTDTPEELWEILAPLDDVIDPLPVGGPDPDPPHFDMDSPEVITVESDPEEDPDPDPEEVITVPDSDPDEEDDLALAAAADPPEGQDYLTCAYCHMPYDNVFANDHDLCPECMIQHFMD